jgi:hypothetical protein
MVLYSDEGGLECKVAFLEEAKLTRLRILTIGGFPTAMVKTLTMVYVDVSTLEKLVMICPQLRVLDMHQLYHVIHPKDVCHFFHVRPGFTS